MAVLTVMFGLVDRVATSDGQIAWPPIVLAAAPMLPLTLIALYQKSGSDSVVRSYYLRLVEREIRDKVD